MGGEGLLVCNEIHPRRARILSSNLERMGVKNALVLNETPERLEVRFEGFFDRVLVDAPCSGEGMFRKHEAASEDWSEELVAMCAARQAGILDAAARMLRPGGRLVYSTCTFSPEENEGSVQGLLDRHPDFSVAAPAVELFAPGRPDWIPGGSEALARCCRLWPQCLRGEGHFAAVLEKSGEAPAGELAPEPGEKLSPALRELFAACGVQVPEGRFVRFGETWFLAPPELPLLRGLKVLRPGLELGTEQKGRAVPAHALALTLGSAGELCELDEEAALRYLSGQTLPFGGRGWTLVRCGGLSLGWGKASAGVLKNHYPKGLRRAAI